MKKFINFASGFTIAELLISLLISAIIAAAMVPVIGLKKIKVPRMVYHHGIAECYYEPVGEPSEYGDYPNWKLMYYYADNNQNKSNQPVEVTENDYCTFTPPSADYYEITAIGPGTDGFVAVPYFQYSAGNSGSAFKEGYIRVDENFQNDIQSAYVIEQGATIGISDDIRRALAEWASSDQASNLYAEYLFDSPIGASTSGIARRQLIQGYSSHSSCNCTTKGIGTECNGPYDNPNEPGYWTESNYIDGMKNAPEEYCWLWVHAEGQDSGYGRRTQKPLRFPLNYNTMITTTTTDIEKTEFEICNVYTPGQCNRLLLKASPNGGFTNISNQGGFDHPSSPEDAPECEGDLCQAAKAEVDNTMVNRAGKQGGTNSFAMDYAHVEVGHTKGVIYYSSARTGVDYDPKDPRKLKWTYNAIEARPWVGYGGNMGKEHTIVYEKLRGKLYLKPAPYKDGDNDDETIVTEDLNNVQSTLVSAAGGGEAGSFKIMKFPLITSDMPMPPTPLKLGKPNNNFVYQPKIEASKYNGGLKNCATQNPDAMWCPGYAGKGQYFYITDVPPANSMSLLNLYNGASYTVSSDKILTQAGVQENSHICDDGVTVPRNVPGTYSYVNSHGETVTFTPKYCQEKMVKGRPGAVIIMW